MCIVHAVDGLFLAFLLGHHRLGPDWPHNTPPQQQPPAEGVGGIPNRFIRDMMSLSVTHGTFSSATPLGCSGSSSSNRPLIGSLRRCPATPIGRRRVTTAAAACCNSSHGSSTGLLLGAAAYRRNAGSLCPPRCHVLARAQRRRLFGVSAMELSMVAVLWCYRCGEMCCGGGVHTRMYKQSGCGVGWSHLQRLASVCGNSRGTFIKSAPTRMYPYTTDGLVVWRTCCVVPAGWRQHAGRQHQQQRRRQQPTPAAANPPAAAAAGGSSSRG